jgi:hypothetical protein
MKNSATWIARERLAETSPELVEALVRLGDEYGPTGVADVAQLIVDGWTTPNEITAINPAPVCPGCGAVAELDGAFWVTKHELDCSWMADPDAEPY